MFDRPLSFGDMFRLIRIGDTGMLGILLFEGLLVFGPLGILVWAAIALP